MTEHSRTEVGLIEERARLRYERYRDHYQDEHWNLGTMPPEWDELPYLERIVLLKTETDMYDLYRNT